MDKIIYFSSQKEQRKNVNAKEVTFFLSYLLVYCLCDSDVCNTCSFLCVCWKLRFYKKIPIRIKLKEKILNAIFFTYLTYSCLLLVWLWCMQYWQILCVCVLKTWIWKKICSITHKTKKKNLNAKKSILSNLLVYCLCDFDVCNTGSFRAEEVDVGAQDAHVTLTRLLQHRI